MKRKAINLSDRWNTYKKDNFKCVICGSSDLDDLTIDHIQPVKNNGENKIENYQTLCNRCNIIKKDNPLGYTEYQKLKKMKKEIECTSLLDDETILMLCTQSELYNIRKNEKIQKNIYDQMLKMIIKGFGIKIKKIE